MNNNAVIFEIHSNTFAIFIKKKKIPPNLENFGDLLKSNRGGTGFSLRKQILLTDLEEKDYFSKVCDFHRYIHVCFTTIFKQAYIHDLG